MPNVKGDSEPDSGTTSPTRPQPLFPGKSERDFLANQAADAKAAMIRTLHDMQDTLAKATNVPSRVKQHPWLAVASAAAVGFIAGAARASAPPESMEHRAAESRSTGRGEQIPPAKKSFLLSTVAMLLADIVRSVATSSTVAAILAKDPSRAHAKTTLATRGELESDGSP